MTAYISLIDSWGNPPPCLFSHVKRMIFNQFAYREPFANITLLYNTYTYVAPNGFISVGGASREQQQQQEKQQINKSNEQK